MLSALMEGIQVSGNGALGLEIYDEPYLFGSVEPV